MYFRSLPWMLIGALAAWDVLHFLPVPADPGPDAEGMLDPPSMVLQGSAVIALLAAMALWRLYQLGQRK